MSPDPAQLPYLLKLLDDESPTVRSAVQAALDGFGPELATELSRLPDPPTAQQLELLHKLRVDVRRATLAQAWRAWLRRRAEPQRLEPALGLISDFLNEERGALGPLLDELAESARRAGRHGDARDLARFLFRDQALVGARADFHHPSHCDLVHVIRHRRGLPIALASVYLLVGRRLDLPIEGCNLPGHFLARVQLGETRYWVDCFNGGRFLTEKGLLRRYRNSAERVKEILHLAVSEEDIVARSLRNLVHAYQERGDEVERAFLLELLLDLERARRARGTLEAGDEPSAAGFFPGQLVRHLRHGYRGVVVDFDYRCQADEAWYRKHPGQPGRDQPWYHVLVHETNQVTYTAEASLEEDPEDQPVNHPLVPLFFLRFEDGAYVRNTQPWPGV